jgi:pSer/pThr/pTyr-binding forkhead associated (FHA) protein
MAKLILSMDGLVLKEISLNKERMTIGRKASNDVQIDNLAISGEHAAVVTILNDSFLEDLNSTNGTLVNGQPAKKYFLKNGDLIELGKYKLKYVAEQVQHVESTDFEKTMVMRPAGVRPAPEMSERAFGAAAAAPVPPVSAGPVGVIQLLNGANAGRELELTKTLTTLGKPGVQVAVIAKRPHGYFITHVEGAQFPVINGQAIDAQANQLKDHDVIEIAGIKMEFFLKS